MRSKVFILRDRPRLRMENGKTVGVESKGNLNELNQLLEDGWIIKSTIELKIYEGIQSIVYNLEMPRKPSGHQA